MRNRVWLIGLVGLLLILGVFIAPTNTTAQSTSLDENKALVQRYYDEILNETDAELANAAMLEIVDSEFNFYHSGSMDPEVGWDGLEQALDLKRTGFPDAHFTVENLLAEDDLVAVRWTFVGTNTGMYIDIPASDNEVKLEGMDLFLVEDGKITELRRIFDILSLARQINAMQ